jgi:hypothetical protein
MTMTTLTLPPKLAEAVEKIRALQNFEKRTGMKCTRSMSEIMGRLTPDELARVSEELFG